LWNRNDILSTVLFSQRCTQAMHVLLNAAGGREEFGGEDKGLHG